MNCSPPTGKRGRVFCQETDSESSVGMSVGAEEMLRYTERTYRLTGMTVSAYVSLGDPQLCHADQNIRQTVSRFLRH